MSLTVLPVKEMRQEMASVLDRVEHGEDVVITQRGRGRAVLVDLSNYNDLIERLEYLEDSVDALTADREGALEVDEFATSLAETK